MPGTVLNIYAVLLMLYQSVFLDKTNAINLLSECDRHVKGPILCEIHCTSVF